MNATAGDVFSCREQPGHKPVQVYVIEDEATRLIKIGISKHPRHRLRDLARDTKHSLRLMFVLPGDDRLERELHQQFAVYRVHGEWFHQSPALHAWFDELRRQLPA